MYIYGRNRNAKDCKREREKPMAGVFEEKTFPILSHSKETALDKIKKKYYFSYHLFLWISMLF